MDFRSALDPSGMYRIGRWKSRIGLRADLSVSIYSEME